MLQNAILSQLSSQLPSSLPRANQPELSAALDGICRKLLQRVRRVSFDAKS